MKSVTNELTSPGAAYPMNAGYATGGLRGRHQAALSTTSL